MFSVPVPIDSSGAAKRLRLNDLCCMYSSDASPGIIAKGFRLGDGDPGKCLFALLLACPNGAAGGDATSILDKVLCVVVFR